MTVTANHHAVREESLPARGAADLRDALREYLFDRAQQAAQAHWSGRVDDESTAPIVDCLRLDEYLGQQIAELGSNLGSIKSYVWHAEANYQRAEQCCLAAVAARRNANKDAEFFVNAVQDVFQFDRALRASVVHKTPEPLRRGEIPTTLTVEKAAKVVGAQRRRIVYQLKASTFSWSASVPSDAVMKAAQVSIENPPDSFWIAEYEEKPSRKYDPIIYASYGEWQVEVARWE